MSNGQEEAINSLIRITARGFYSTPYILVLESLLWHKILSDDDMRQLLNIQPKELRTICQKLVEDRLLVEYKQREPLNIVNNREKEKEKEREKERAKEKQDDKEKPKEGNNKENDKDSKGQSRDRFHFQRQITRTYYFIHYSIAIDSIKWKVDSVVKKVDSELSKTNEKGFVCPRCKKKFSELDIQSLFNDDYTDAYCNICNSVLIEDDLSEQAKVKHEKSIKLKGQLDPILQWLKKIDDTTIEDNSVEACFLSHVPANDTSNALYTKINRTGVMFDKNSMYNNGNGAARNQFESTTIRVNIAGDHEDSARREAETMRMKLDKLEQNALPNWYQESTVGKQALGKLNADEEAAAAAAAAATASADTVDSSQGETAASTANMEVDSFAADNQTASLPSDTSYGTTAPSVQKASEADELAAYYEKLKAQKDQEDDEEDEDDADDEDFDEFEDV